MKLLKQSFYVLVILFVVVIAWVGLSIYFQMDNTEIDPNASSYTKEINPSFDTEEIQKIDTRITEGFSVSPEEFTLLTEDNSSN